MIAVGYIQFIFSFIFFFPYKFLEARNNMYSFLSMYAVTAASNVCSHGQHCMLVSAWLSTTSGAIS